MRVLLSGRTMSDRLAQFEHAVRVHERTTTVHDAVSEVLHLTCRTDGMVELKTVVAMLTSLLPPR